MTPWSAELQLTDFDRALLAGEEGPGVRMAMSILVRMAPVYGAERLLDITAAHIDSSVYMGPATLQFAEKLAGLGARVRVPSTLNVSGVDEHGWKAWSVDHEWATGATRQMDAYRKMGCIETWTCAPYQTEYRPKFGQQIAAGESNAIAFYNSVIGARTERYPDLLDICAAITGRAPASGLHLDAPRAARIVVRLDHIPLALQEESTFYPVLGHELGIRTGGNVAVITGLDVRPTEDQLKALGAAAASSGQVALFHIEGVTPEAPTLEAATQGLSVERYETVTLSDLKRARQALSTTDEPAIDAILLGSPHFSFDEFRQLANLSKGQEKHPDVEVIITCSRTMRDLVERTGHMNVIREFGARITVDTCPLVTPMLPGRVKRIMTNSAKYAYYSPGLLGTSVRFGSLADCVASARSGRYEESEGPWTTA